MPPVEFEPAIPASEWPQTHALDRADHWDRYSMVKKFKACDNINHHLQKLTAGNVRQTLYTLV